MKRIGISLIWIFMAAAVCSAQNTVYFPQVVGGLQGNVGWATGFMVTNPAAAGSPAASGTITLYQDNGMPFNIAGNFMNSFTQQAAAGPGNTISFQISGGQTRYFLLEEPNFPLATGFAKLTSTLPLVASSVFIEAYVPSGVEIAWAGVPGAVASARQSAFVVRDEGVDFGLAYANPNTAPATVTFQLLNTTGVAVGSPVTRTLEANNHGALFVSELFPTMPARFFGTMTITTAASTPVTAITLLFTSAGLFSTVPMIPLP
jgi:hypothetical protein